MDTIKMPRVRDLFKEAIDFTKINYKVLIKINLFYIAVIFSVLASTVIVYLVTSIIFENEVADFISVLWVSLGFMSTYLFIFQMYIGVFKGNLKSLSDELNDYYLKIKSATWTSILHGFISNGAYLLFIVPGIFLAIPFMFLPFVFCEKNISGMKALSYSYDLTKNKWWDTFFIILKVFIVLFIIIASFVSVLILFNLLNSAALEELAILSVLISMIFSIILIFYLSFIMMRINYKIFEWLEKTKTYTATETDFKTRKTIFSILFIIGLMLFVFSELGEDKKGDMNNMHRKDRAGYDRPYMMNQKFMDMKIDIKSDLETK